MREKLLPEPPGGRKDLPGSGSKLEVGGMEVGGMEVEGWGDGGSLSVEWSE